VLWFDLMFDVQTRKHEGNVLPPDVLASISAYYRRVTTEAYPMNRLVALVMLLTLAAICAEIWQSLISQGVYYPKCDRGKPEVQFSSGYC